jgi:PST family polysaccharide transporter
MSKALRATWQKHQTILGNFFSLSILQVATYLAPLITLPYLVRVLGPSRFGLVELAHAIAVYLVILTDYGFNLSATREISLCRNDPRRLSEIFSAVMLLKLLLTVASFFALVAAVFAVPRLRGDWPVYLLTSVIRRLDLFAVLFSLLFAAYIAGAYIVYYLIARSRTTT